MLGLDWVRVPNLYLPLGDGVGTQLAHEAALERGGPVVVPLAWLGLGVGLGVGVRLGVRVRSGARVGVGLGVRVGVWLGSSDWPVTQPWCSAPPPV